MSGAAGGAEETAEARPPYQGLVPYTEDDADWFYGRKTWSEIITDNLRAYRVSVLYGASGVGKSSVLRAGVVRGLRGQAHDDGRLALLTVAFSSWSLDDPVGALKAAVHEAVEGAAPDLTREPPEGSLADVLAAWAARIDCSLLLVLDQFEELFLYAESHDRERSRRHESAADELEQALRRRDPSVHFLLSIREDALASLDRFKRRVPGLLDRLLRLEHLDRASAEEAIRKPLERWNSLVEPAERVAVEPDLVTEILDQVQESASDGDGGGAASVRAGEIEAPYLQLVLTRLWDEERRLWAGQNGRPRELRVETLNKRLGRVETIVDTHVDTALRDLPPKQQAVAAAVFRQLVTPSRTKIALGLDDLHAQTQVPEQAIDPVVRRLSAPGVRILRPAGEGRYEIFHDALSRPILAWLARWADRQRRRRERRRLALAVGAALVLAALAGVFVLLLLRSRAAEDRAAQAKTLAQRQSSKAVASSALAELQLDPARALRSALRAVAVHRTPEAAAAVRTVLAQSLLDRAFSVPSRVFAGAYSPDGKLLAIGGDDLRVWETATGRPVATLDTHGSPVEDLAFDPHGSRVAAALNDGKAEVWDLATGKGIVFLHGKDSIPGAIRFSPNGRLIATAGQDGTAKIWSAASGRRLEVLRHPNAFVNTVSFSPDSKLVVTTSLDGPPRVWRVTGGPPLATLAVRGSSANAIFSGDGRLVLAANSDGAARVWDFRRGRSVVLRGHVGLVLDAAFSPDGALVATAGADGTARLWRARDGRNVALLSGHTAAVESVEFDRAGRLLLTAGDDGTARLWSVQNGRALAVYTNGGPVYAAGLRKDGTQVFTAAVEGNSSTVRVWRTRGTEQPSGVLATGTGDIAVSPDVRLVAVAGPGRAVRVLRTADLGEAASLTMPGRATLSRFSADGRLLLAGDGRGTVRVWRVGDWNHPRGLRTGAAIDGAAFSRNNRLIAAVSGGTARVLNASTGDQLPGASVVLQDTQGFAAPSDPEFSPDGRFVLLGGGAAQLWDYRRRPGSTRLLGMRSDDVNTVQVSRDGKLLLGQGLKTAVLWRLDGPEPREIARHPAEESALSPDGTLVATVRQGTIELWRTASAKRVRTVATRDDFPAVVFGPTGRILVTVGADSVRLSDTRTGSALAALAGLPDSSAGRAWVALSKDGTRIVVVGDSRSVVYHCAACGTFEDVLAQARRQSSRLRLPAP